jgi:hypothetical protein
MDSLALSGTALFTWPAILVQLVVIAFSLFVWRSYLSPLADIPGPFVASFSRLWHIRHIWIGDQNLQLQALHEKHGHFVRVASNEISVSHPDGIKQILLQPLWKVSISRTEAASWD